MAVANLYAATFGSPQGVVSMAVNYDTTSLILQQLAYNNPTSRPGTLTLAGPFDRTVTCQANDQRTVDLTSFNLQAVHQQVTDRWGTRTVTMLPGGETVQFTWPT